MAKSPHEIALGSDANNAAIRAAYQSGNKAEMARLHAEVMMRLEALLDADATQSA
jgi:hypothetical protein